jgi:hypothetical protein
VADVLGVTIESGTVDPGPPASAYLLVEGRAPSHPDRVLALLWDDRHGWSAAVTTHVDEEGIVLGYLGGVRAVAEPAEVERFAAAVRDGWSPTGPRPEFGPSNDLDRYAPVGNVSETSAG